MKESSTSGQNTPVFGLLRRSYRPAFRILRGCLIAIGGIATLYLVWMAAGWPIFLDRFLDVSVPAKPAEFIVCLSGGLAANNLPTSDGWSRIYTAVQLQADGFGRKIVFSGGGAGKVTEAEVYGEAAGWLGCPEAAMEFESDATSTAEHAVMLLKSKALGISRQTPLNIVTSPLHSRRVSLCFKKAGFVNFRVVARHEASKAGPGVARESMASRFGSHVPSGKSYNDILTELRERNSYLFAALREVTAIIVYKLKDDI